MGLDIWTADRYDAECGQVLAPDAPRASWSYGGFHRFRQLLAAEDGIDLECMAGFTEPPEAGRSWSLVESTLAPLLNHSDCDGELTPDECSAILPRLKEIRVTWGKSSDAETFWDVEHLDALIDVVTYCAATGVKANFR